MAAVVRREPIRMKRKILNGISMATAMGVYILV